jgi:hypothetical protein
VQTLSGQTLVVIVVMCLDRPGEARGFQFSQVILYSSKSSTVVAEHVRECLRTGRSGEGKARVFFTCCVSTKLS